LAQRTGNNQAILSCLRTNSNSASNTNNSNNNGMTIYDSLSSSYRTLPQNPNNQPPSSRPPKAAPTATTNTGTAWYVCGPTVYDSAHLGHGRTYVSLDILRRVVLNNYSHMTPQRQQQPRPLYVMNITDVDDKIIQRSMEKGSIGGGGGEVDPLLLARHYEHEFWQDLDALNVLRPDVICRVSEHVESTIVPYIQQIVDGGMAYVIPEQKHMDGNDDGNEDGTITNQQQQSRQPQGSVYFDVRAFESITNGRTKYGKLAPDVASTDFFSWESNSNNDDDDDNNEGEPIRTKRDPRDFCLWKYRPRSSSSREPVSIPTIIEPSSVSYSSPWGPGRPGWHVECSAMIQQLAQDFRSTHEFAVHAGGVDLKFPHHSNEIAQAEAFMASSDIHSQNNRQEDFKEWIPHWIHTGHLYVKGRKMSKSLKNFVTIREMLGMIPNTHSERMTNDAIISALDQDNNAWSSPADDFRLWVLGLSGAYRGPATYSEERMEEARVIREKWVRFLMEGQECLERWNNMVDFHSGDDADAANHSKSSRLWGEEDLQLFHTVTRCSMNCQRALLDDLDGSLFVKELIRIADVGMTYVQQVKIDGQNNKQLSKNRPEEPLRFVLDTFRGHLDLVGFTQRTVNAGISSGQQQQIGALASSTSTSLLDEAVAFRAAVRSAALGAVRKKKDSLEAVKEILKLCDELRDDTFPKLGVEILDGKVVVETNAEGDDVANRGWRHCSPRERVSKTNK